MDLKAAVRKQSKARLAKSGLADLDLAKHRARLIGKTWGFLRVTDTGYDYGHNTDPDGIMLTLRPR